MKDIYYLLKVKIYKDPEAFAHIYRQYVDNIYKYIFFRVNNEEDAQDITSEVFLKAWNYLTTQQKEVHSIKSFLYILSRNTVIDYYRQQRIEVVSCDSMADKLSDQGLQKCEIMAKSDTEMLQNKVKEALRGMKEEYREVIVLKYINGLNTSEIAKIIDKNNSATRVLLHRALKQLKDKIEVN